MTDQPGTLIRLIRQPKYKPVKLQFLEYVDRNFEELAKRCPAGEHSRRNKHQQFGLVGGTRFCFE